MQASKAILLILTLVTAAAAVGVSACGTAGFSAHTGDAVLASVVALTAAIAGLLPISLRTERTSVVLFQSAWFGSVLHLAVSAGLGCTLLYCLKLATPFVVWLLVMYWVTLIGLCVAFIKTLRSPTPGHLSSDPAQRVTFG